MSIDLQFVSKDVPPPSHIEDLGKPRNTPTLATYQDDKPPRKKLIVF